MNDILPQILFVNILTENYVLLLFILGPFFTFYTISATLLIPFPKYNLVFNLSIWSAIIVNV